MIESCCMSKSRELTGSAEREFEVLVSSNEVTSVSTKFFEISESGNDDFCHIPSFRVWSRACWDRCRVSAL